ncbi:hypothetical protein JY97_06945 [Alkalispirochaeta odontotermitis]|nr:hypothetical protein JY97_06945 [Alkalispirochaeta odontotermitis]
MRKWESGNEKWECGSGKMQKKKKVRRYEVEKAAFGMLPSTCSGPEAVERQGDRSPTAGV